MKLCRHWDRSCGSKRGGGGRANSKITHLLGRVFLHAEDCCNWIELVRAWALSTCVDCSENNECCAAWWCVERGVVRTSLFVEKLTSSGDLPVMRVGTRLRAPQFIVCASKGGGKLPAHLTPRQVAAAAVSSLELAQWVAENASPCEMATPRNRRSDDILQVCSSGSSPRAPHVAITGVQSSPQSVPSGTLSKTLSTAPPQTWPGSGSVCKTLFSPDKVPTNLAA